MSRPTDVADVTAWRTQGGRGALLVALGIDNVGSGLFLPLVLVYLTTVVGLPLAAAGTVVSAGTLVGLLAPPLAGRVVDRLGPRAVVVVSQVLQAAGMLAYLLAVGPVSALVAATLVAAGTQTFYSALFALIADVAPPGPADRSFAVVDMVRSAAFGAGALVSALLLARAGAGGLRIAVTTDAISFALAALVLAAFVHPRRHPHDAGPDARGAGAGAEPRARAGTASGPVWADRPYLLLILTAGLLGLGTDVFLVGMPVYAVDQLSAPAWVPGVALGLLTLLGSTCTTAVLAATSTWRRTSAMAAGAACLVVWAVASAAAAWVPDGGVVPVLLGSTLVLAAGALLSGTRANALAETAAPPAARGRYLGAFQYAFTAAALLAPLVVSLFAVASWLPWLVVALAAAAALVLLPLLAGRLPAGADGVAARSRRSERRMLGMTSGPGRRRWSRPR